MSNNPKPVKFPNKVTGRLRIGNTAADYGVYGTGTVQKFELGTRYRQDDRVFRYGKASSETDLNPKLGAYNDNIFFGENTVEETVAGQMYVVITTDGTSGSLTSGFGLANSMVGGYMSIPSNTDAQFRRIEGHVAAPIGTTVKVYLDGPINYTQATNAGIEWFQNPYSNMRTPGGNMSTVMGVPNVTIVASSFGWFQTWGPRYINVNSAGVGSGAYDRTVVFNSTGSIDQMAEGATVVQRQVAGWIVDKSQSGDWSNPPLVWLTITP